MMDCKKALVEADGDMNSAVEILRKKGQKVSAKRSDRDANEGSVFAHGNGSSAILIELNCETDFVARNDDFVKVGKDIAMQIAAMNPMAIDKDGVDTSIVEQELKIGREQAIAEGKPEKIIDKIAQGKLGKFYKDNTLLNQDFVKDSSKTIKQYLKEKGPDLTVKAFHRVQLGAN
ncbi:UNVERIFIED_CONTAM: hypothetical protein GTU68_057431 [Idotea baltica]|nr:hypothetical protein [Idotea baltica]